MIYRIYYNREAIKPWSLDTGKGTIEHNTERLNLINCSATTCENFTNDNIKEPRAWFMVQGEAVFGEKEITIKGN